MTLPAISEYANGLGTPPAGMHNVAATACYTAKTCHCIKRFVAVTGIQPH